VYMLRDAFKHENKPLELLKVPTVGCNGHLFF
jgi:hypothetical protein